VSEEDNKLEIERLNKIIEDLNAYIAALNFQLCAVPEGGSTTILA
jgi:hypothetical protein